MPSPALLADLTVLLHLVYLLFVVAGFVLILLGAARGWRWIRNVWFRLAHLAAIGLVVLETVLGLACPLTTLESWFRTQAGEEPGQESFMARVVASVLFHDWPEWVFALLYVALGGTVLVTMILVPPRRKLEKHGLDRPVSTP